MTTTAEIDAMLQDAEDHAPSGWDFSWIRDRTTTSHVDWDFREMVRAAAQESPDLLDMGTGGGEWLAGLPDRPPLTIATEGWPPNVPIARDRLNPLGIDVVAASGGPDNVDQGGTETTPPIPGTDGALPFASGSLHLVSNRHESYVPSEIRRILAPGGLFLTQQVGSGHFRKVRELFGYEDRESAKPTWDLGFAIDQLERAGLTVVDGGEGCDRTTYHDVGALAWYLIAVPWTVPGFTVGGYRARLHELQADIDRGQPPVIETPMFWLRATRPG